MIKINRFHTKLSILFLIAIIATAICGVSQARAEDFFDLEAIPQNSTQDIHISAINAYVIVPAQDFASDAWIKMTSLIPKDFIHSYFQYPDNIGPQTDLYSIRFPEGISFAKMPKVKIKFDKSDPSSQLYFYNWGKMSFEKAEAKKDLSDSTFNFDYPKDKDFVMFAVFGSPQYEGNASWYVHPKYAGQMIAASTQFPNGTKLRVVNPENNKSVIVTVRDYGPDPNLHPDRVVDLSKEAFAAIAKASQGVIKVRVSKVQ